MRWCDKEQRRVERQVRLLLSAEPTKKVGMPFASSVIVHFERIEQREHVYFN